nr:ParB/RepB/Spo0J family partition protein [uncultured Agathobacter sp.]
MNIGSEKQRDGDEKVVEIEIERLHDFKNHPFKVQADSQMKELQDSISKYGILNPLIVRPRPEGFYEVISGHRGKYAAMELKYTKVPVIIRYMLDEEAIISMVDSNLQRERILPSEKAAAYKMKYEVLRRKAGRRKCSQVDYTTGKKSIEIIGEETGDSPKQIQRYLKLNDLIPELLDKVDDETMGFTIGVELAYLSKTNQEIVLEAMENTLATPNLSQAIRIKKMQEEEKISVDSVEAIITEVKQKEITRVVFKNEQLYRYFPSYYTAEQMRREILTLLKINMESY